jgi:hypothetical protein
VKLTKCFQNEIISFWKHLIKNNDTKLLKTSPENLKSDVENNMFTNPFEAEATEDE